MPNEPTAGPATDPRIRTLRERDEPSSVNVLHAAFDALPAETREHLVARMFGTTAETIGDALGLFYATRRDTIATELRRTVARIENEHGLTDDRHEHETRHRELLDLADEVANMAAMLRDTVRLHALARGVIA